MFYIYIKEKTYHSACGRIFLQMKNSIQRTSVILAHDLNLRMLLMFECAAIECLAKKLYKTFIYLF